MLRLDTVALLALAALSCNPARAQVQTPGAGAIAGPAPVVRQQGEQQERRQQERDEVQRDLLQRAPGAPTRAAPTPERAWPINEVNCREIRSVALAGDADDRFSAILNTLVSGSDPAVGRCLGVAGINVAADRAHHALMGLGFVTSRILLQPQDLSEGRLTLTLVPGRIRAVRFARSSDVDTDNALRANARNAVPAGPGDILNLRDIEQALENFKRVPTVEADVRIEPADAPDQSDLVVVWRQAFPLRLNMSIDDSGTRSTGRYQGSTTLSYDHWWTLNDLFYVTLNRDLGGGDTGARGSRASTVHYSVPLDYWLLGLTASSSRYHQTVAGAVQNYVYSGASDNAEVRLSRVVYRDARRKATASLKGWMRRATNAIDDTEIQVNRRATGGWELALTHREFMGPATLDASVSHRRGTGAFHAIAAPEEAFGEGTSRMQLTALDMNLQWPFTAFGQRLHYLSNWRAQWNGTPLSPQDRFAIGGRYTVRGFDGESSLSAERGWFVRNELGVVLGDSGQQAYAGIDYGQVRGDSDGNLVGRHLAGLVLGLRGGIDSFSYDIFVGRPLSRPEYFRTASVTAGFSISVSF